jgi:hypothetical protein
MCPNSVRHGYCCPSPLKELEIFHFLLASAEIFCYTLIHGKGMDHSGTIGYL